MAVVGVVLGKRRSAVVPSVSKSLSFDGVDDYVLVPNTAILNPANTITVEAWIKPSSISGPRTIVAKYGDSANADSYLLYLNNGKLGFYIRDTGASAWRFTAGVAAFQTGIWKHVAGTFDGTTIRSFIDGVQDASTAYAGSIPSSPSNLRIGAPGAAVPGGERFAGLIDEVRLWNTVRTAAQLSANKDASLVGNQSGLVGYWKFDEGSGQTVADATGNGLTGQLGGSSGADSTDPTWSSDTPF